MKKRYKGYFVASLCVFCSVITAAICLIFIMFKLGGPDSYREIMKYLAVRSVIDNEFIGDFDAAEVEDATLKAMVAATGDKWSYYMNSAEYESYKMYSENRYAGIGVTIYQNSGGAGLVVASVSPDSPAEKAGILPGMIMTAINGMGLEGKTASDVKEIIQDNLSETIDISMLGEDGLAFDVQVNTDIIYSDPVSWEMIYGNIGYIKLSNFEEGCAEGALGAIETLTREGATGIIFDVRNNPGGRVSQLLHILDAILPEGDIFVSIDKSGHEKISSSGAECIKTPMAVLINSNSYSAAEFFAAALSEYDWATTVGEHTTGKSRSQTTIELSDGSAVHISSGAYLTPKRVDLSETGGLRPDIEIALDEEESSLLLAGRLPGEEDPQIKAAALTLGWS